jgi:hypothetical protein
MLIRKTEIAFRRRGCGIPGGPSRMLAVGAAADLRLLDRPWAEGRRNL